MPPCWFKSEWLGIGASIYYDVERRTTALFWLQWTTVNPSVFDLKMPKRCVAAGCSNERNLEEGFSPSQTAILRRRSARSQEKEKEMGGFCSAEASEMRTISVFSAVLWAWVWVCHGFVMGLSWSHVIDQSLVKGYKNFMPVWFRPDLM